METSLRKFTYLAFFFAAGLVALISFLVGESLLNLFKVPTQTRLFSEAGANAFFLTHQMIAGGAAAVIGLGTWLGLAFNTKAVEFTDECVSELWKVTWPTRQETTASTIVVSIMVLIAALIFFLMDLVWSNVFRWIL